MLKKRKEKILDVSLKNYKNKKPIFNIDFLYYVNLYFPYLQSYQILCVVGPFFLPISTTMTQASTNTTQDIPLPSTPKPTL